MARFFMCLNAAFGCALLGLWLTACEPSGADHPYAVAFVTSSVHTGNLGGLAGADDICAERAADVGLDGTFVALLSTSSTTAFSRIENGSGWVLVNGTPVATTPSELVTGAALAPIALDERGHDVRGVQDRVWTGSEFDGTAAPDKCADWTTDDPVSHGAVAAAATGGTAALNEGVEICASPRRLYCLETDRRSAVTVTPAGGRFAFVSSAAWLVNAVGVPDADRVCQSEASAAGLPGTYLALLPTATTTAVSRFDVTGAPWMNTAEIALAASAERLFTAQSLDTFLNRFANGSVVRQSLHVMSADPSSSAAAPCASWTDPAGAMDPVGGLPHKTNRERFVASYLYPTCASTTLHLYCLQQ